MDQAHAVRGLSTALTSMPRSGIRRIFDLAGAMPDAIHLEVGEPDFPTPPHIIEAAHEAASSGFTGYTPNAGIAELREHLAAKVGRVNGITAEPDDVLVTTGGVQALCNAFIGLVDPGDEVLCPDPGWPNFRMQLNLVGAVARPYRLEASTGFVPTVELLDRLVGPRTKVVILNSPANPTGAVIGESQMRELLAWAVDRDLWVVADECYDEIVFDGDLVSAGALDPDGRVLTVFSFSKTYAMTGWRVGYLVGSPELTPMLAKLQEAIVSCVNGPSQKAAVAALTGPQDVVAEMCDAYRTRRDKVMAILDEAGVNAVRPEGAFYVWVDVRDADATSEEFAHRLLTRRHVATVPGTAFGDNGEGWIRISLATAAEPLLEGVRRLTEELGALTAGEDAGAAAT